MKYKITIAQQGQPGGTWKEIYEVVTEVMLAEKAARQIEREIQAEGLSINGATLRNILAEEFGER